MSLARRIWPKLANRHTFARLTGIDLSQPQAGYWEIECRRDHEIHTGSGKFPRRKFRSSVWELKALAHGTPDLYYVSSL